MATSPDRLCWLWVRLALARWRRGGGLPWLGVGLLVLALCGAARASCPAGQGLAQQGSAGLFDLPIADPGCPWQLRLGVWGQGFVQSSLVLADDRNAQLTGGLQLAATLGSYVEGWLEWSSRSNRNQRPLLDRSSDGSQPILGLGRTALGIKLHSPLGGLGHLAIAPLLRVHSGPFDFGPNFGSTDFGLDFLGSLDLATVWPRLPLRLHLRAGYLYDRSGRVLDALDCMARGGAECLATRLIYTTAYDVGQPRLELGLGAEVQFSLGHRLSLGPALSYRLSAVTSDGDPVLRAQLAMQLPSTAPADVESRLAQLLTVGAHLQLPWPVSVELGLALTLSSWGYVMGPRLPLASGYAALSFGLDVGSRRRDSAGSRDGVSLPPPSQLAAPSRNSGSIHGQVRDAQTRAPLAGAVVRFIGVAQNALLSDERGHYQSGALPLGPLTVEASRGDHQTARLVVVVRPGELGGADLELATAVRPAVASLWVELQDDGGGSPAAVGVLSRQVAGAAASASSGGGPGFAQTVALSPQGAGLFARLPGGSWLLRLDAVGYLSREQVVVLPAGEERRLTVLLPRRPPLPRARLGIDEILLSEPLSFAGEPQHPQLSPASGSLLDEVIDLLIHHPELRQVRIEGTGPEVELSLIAVRDFLLQGGIAPERVIAVEMPAVARPSSAKVSLRIVR